MALHKRGKTWHTQFFLDGIRYRQSLETTDYREALSKEKELIALAKAGKLSASRNAISKLTFPEAATELLADRTAHLAALVFAPKKSVRSRSTGSSAKCR